MKKFILLMVAITFLTALNAQSFHTAKPAGFNTSSGEATDETFLVEGKSFEVLKTSKGVKYIQATSSKTGNKYPVWIFESTGLSHEGHEVYVTAKGTYCIYKLAKSGFPYPVWLEKD